MNILLMRFDAPLMSFGGPAVDHVGVVTDMPATSLLAGLLANALGWTHGEADRLQKLQARLRHAARRDRSGERLLDYQTVDLERVGSEAWTTRGRPEGRRGGSAKTGTHIRQRHYLADAIYTIALTLVPERDEPTLDDLARALQEPVRPLFIGRRCCLPSGPILLDRIAVPSLDEALNRFPRVAGRGDVGGLAAWWPEGDDSAQDTFPLAVTDERDWANQAHVGRRFVHRGVVSPQEIDGDA